MVWGWVVVSGLVAGGVGIVGGMLCGVCFVVPASCVPAGLCNAIVEPKEGVDLASYDDGRMRDFELKRQDQCSVV